VANECVLLIDLGNSRLKWALVEQIAPGQLPAVGAERVGAMSAIPYVRNAPDFSAAAQAIGATLGPRHACEVWISSVAGTATDALQLALHSAGIGAGLRAHARAKLGRLRSGYRAPEQLGVDRFLACLAAAERWPQQASLLAIVGTALTIDFVDTTGLHRGGLIAPGPSLMRQSLRQGTAGLNVPIAPKALPAAFADNTLDAIDGGCSRACAALILDRWQQAKSASAAPVQLVLSGGGAAQVQQLLPPTLTLCPELVLLGLAHYRALV
jgi:type III pantothenate kinase